MNSRAYAGIYPEDEFWMAMTEHTYFPDRESASLDGSAFGAEVAARTAASMTGVAMDDDELQAIGERGIAEVAARAEALTSSGVEAELVVAWLQSAADAFTSELDRTARTLVSPGPSDTKR